ncbi:MAG: hypothetical protein SGJ27_19635 [Candidatus Melainabacteria bacterium]|nr:hypothetical protein [Candidatus Melainabacteria bacterium]
MTDKVTEAKPEIKTVGQAAPESGESLSTTNQEKTVTFAESLDGRVKSISAQLGENGLMPAMSQAEVPSTLAKAVVLFDRQNIGVPADGGRSSGSAVSALLKASGADVSPTMDIGKLHGQLAAKGWESVEYKPGDILKPGDLLFTDLNPHRRNVGIVGENGKIYSHNITMNQFQGRENWTSKFVSVMRPPGSDK